MAYSHHYQLALLQLAHLLFSADDSLGDEEMQALNTLRQEEAIDNKTFDEFRGWLKGRSHKEIHEHGIELIGECSNEERMHAFAYLYHLSRIDGNVHVKEVRLLLYSIKLAGIDFDEVVRLSTVLWPPV